VRAASNAHCCAHARAFALVANSCASLLHSRKNVDGKKLFESNSLHHLEVHQVLSRDCSTAEVFEIIQQHLYA
jgi:predicted alpha-1,6-mannanase (GH76 family)